MIEGKGDDEHRHRCLVRWVIRRRIHDRDAAHRWLAGYYDLEKLKHVNGWNDLHPSSVLERDVKDQWAKGNRGEDGDWRE